MSSFRTPDQIVTRIRDIESVPFDDFFGAQRSDLVRALPFELAKPWLDAEVTAEQWTPDPDPLTSALAYVSFAVGKIVDHRGLSANRSVDHFKAWAGCGR